jgi:CRP/FNR family transcriptional regulator, cyclic AMP receptor protein
MKELTILEKTFFLKKHALFSNLELELLLVISDKIIQDEYDKDEKVFEIDQIANRMYFIYKGEVKISTNDKKITYLRNNEYFGEESLFNDLARSYEATCIKNTVFLTLSRTNLMTIISECPTLAISFLEKYTTIFPCRHFLL